MLLEVSCFVETTQNSPGKMSCSRGNYLKPQILSNIPTRKPSLRTNTIAFSSYAPNKEDSSSSSSSIDTLKLNTDACSVGFKTLGACKLGISRYPDFGYNAEGGTGAGTYTRITDNNDSDKEISVCFDITTLYIPPLTSATTKFLGLPLPPFLKIDIVPQLFTGIINPESGKVN